MSRFFISTMMQCDRSAHTTCSDHFSWATKSSAIACMIIRRLRKSLLRGEKSSLNQTDSLRSWRDFARECFCFGKPAREYGGSAAAHASRQLRRLRQCHQYYESFQLKIILSKTSADFRCPRLPRRHGSSSRDKERTDDLSGRRHSTARSTVTPPY